MSLAPQKSQSAACFGLPAPFPLSNSRWSRQQSLLALELKDINQKMKTVNKEF